VCTETTEKVTNLKNLEETNNQLAFAIEATELGTWDYNPFTNKFTGNVRLKEWFGLQPEEEIDLGLAIVIMAEKDQQRVTTAIQNALQYSSGGHFDVEYAIVHPLTGKERIVKAKGRAWFGDDKIAYRFNGNLQDVTEQVLARKKIEKSEAKMRSIIAAAPAGIGLLWAKI
jgi:PAS domain S-box-containing protein